MFTGVALMAFIYSLPIVCVRRFQHRNNIFTWNVCCAILLNSLSRLVTSVSPLFGYSLAFVRKKWPWLYVLQIVSDVAIPYTLVLVSFHRCFAIVYPVKRVFQTKIWMMACFAGQWILIGLLSIPDFVHPRSVGLSVQWSCLSDCLSASLDIAYPVATIVDVRNYVNPSSNDLCLHKHTDLLPCSLLVEPRPKSRHNE
jgi:hypothetical protein